MKAAKLIKKLKLSDNSVILLKKDELALGGIEEIKNALERTTLKNILVLVVDDLENVRALPQIEMQRYGWYRVEYLMDKVLRKKKEESNAESTEPTEQEK